MFRTPLKTSSLSLAAVVLACSGVAAHAAVVEHTGNNDPTTEGFTYDNLGAGVTAGGVTNDNGTGVDAWSVDDSGSGYGLYYNGFSATEQSDLLTQGFTATMKLRLADIVSDAPGGSVAVDVNLGAGNKRFLVYFGTNADGDPNFYFNDGNFSYPTVTGANGGYHTFKLIYDPGTTTADIFLDNVQLKDDFAGLAGNAGNYGNSFGQAVFGSGSGGDQGQGNYASFIVAIPEPASLALLGMGGLLMFSRRRSA